MRALWKNLSCTLPVAACLLLGAPMMAHAQTQAVQVPHYSNYTNGSWSLGFVFSPTVDIIVTDLGSYFPGGATDTHGVGLWDASGNELASATVTGNSTEGFDFTAITGVALTAGQNYVVSGSTLSDAYAVAHSITVAPQINFLGHVELPCGGVAACFPGSYTGGGDGDFGGNFEFTAGVPEPATWALMIGGFGLAGAALRRRRAPSAA